MNANRLICIKQVSINSFFPNKPWEMKTNGQLITNQVILQQWFMVSTSKKKKSIGRIFYKCELVQATFYLHLITYVHIDVLLLTFVLAHLGPVLQISIKMHQNVCVGSFSLRG